ncbi:monoglyceride lipase-like protein [Corchorus capsularis]|uniref:Monoglyceride lipase-like protein n=1 Tax=Corchorus capsularis TaxID=210143 RepID=A0A1R3G898_COCAP|nr:monoglyceride lipase-like protein [Corchorus capsularis]
MQPYVDTEKLGNFWGDMPEEEYYTSQGVRNTKSYFQTPNGRLFTQSFLPLDQKIKASVYMTHGYGSDTGWLFQKFCINFASWGYAVFAADLLGHGRSEGLRCYLGDMEKVAAASLSFFKHVRYSEEYKDLPAFLLGESAGGAATMLMYFQSEPNDWTGLIFSAPLFVIPEPMKPSKVRLFMYGLLFGLADTWAAMPENRMVAKAIKDPEKLKVIASNPRRYTGPPRVGSMRELARVTQYIQANFSKVAAPFLTLHGTSDGLACATGSQMLYEKASSTDKCLKLYDGMYHSLIQGEPDENANLVLKDMREWIDERVESVRDRKNSQDFGNIQRGALSGVASAHFPVTVHLNVTIQF